MSRYSSQLNAAIRPLALMCLGLHLWANGGWAQESTRSRVGIAHIGALGAHVGSASVQRSAEGVEAGLRADLGWLTGRRLRLQAEIDLLRATLTEFVEVEDSTYHGDIYDLTTSLGALLILSGERSRLMPYFAAGLGVHALSSAFESLTLDTRYNANPFGAHIAAGMTLRLSSRSGLAVEWRGVLAENVNRTGVRVAGLWFFGDLVRR